MGREARSGDEGRDRAAVPQARHLSGLPDEHVHVLRRRAGRRHPPALRQACSRAKNAHDQEQCSQCLRRICSASIRTPSTPGKRRRRARKSSRRRRTRSRSTPGYRPRRSRRLQGLHDVLLDRSRHARAGAGARHPAGSDHLRAVESDGRVGDVLPVRDAVQVRRVPNKEGHSDAATPMVTSPRPGIRRRRSDSPRFCRTLSWR